MRRSGRTPGRAFRISICCTCGDDPESEPATTPSTAPAGPRPGQITRLTPRSELGPRRLRGPVARLPPGLQVGDGGSSRRSRALTQTGISEATLVAGSQPSDLELHETQPPAGQITPTERREAVRASVVQLSTNPSSRVERDRGLSSSISSLRDPPTQGAHQETLVRSPGDSRVQDETHQRRRRSLYVENSPRVHDTRQRRRRSLAMDNVPAQESRLEASGRARGPEGRSALDETRQRRRRSSQMDSLRRLESPATGPEGHSSAPHETRQSRRRSLHIDSSPHRPELGQHRRRSYLQNPPRLSQPGEDSDLGRLAHPPFGVEHLFPESASPNNESKYEEGGASNAEKGKDDVKKGKSSKEGAGGEGEGGSA